MNFIFPRCSRSLSLRSLLNFTVMSSTIVPILPPSVLGNTSVLPSVIASPLSVPTHEFGLNLMQHLNRGNADKNILFSPLSVILCFSMLLEGAHGETEKQMKEVLRLMSIGNQSDVNEASKKLLEGYQKIEDGTSDRNLTLTIGNLAILNKKAILKAAYAQSLASNYFAQASNEDFTNTTAVMDKLNAWVSQKTHGKIDKLLTTPPDEETILMLVNTLYFKGKWIEPFPKASTYDDSFNNGDGSVSKIKMMAVRDKKFNYAHNPDKKVKIVELPYYGNASMILIMPTENNTLASLVSSMNTTELNDLIGSMTSTKLRTVCLPKFKLEDNHKLHQILPAMGMNLPFTDSAELPFIAEKSELKVSQSLQKALLEVDEEGSTAAAATLIVTVLRMSYFPAEDFIADRPFLFMIRDNLSKVNLFMGQMSKMASVESQPVAVSTETSSAPLMAEPASNATQTPVMAEPQLNATQAPVMAEPKLNVTQAPAMAVTMAAALNATEAASVEPPMNKTA